MSNQRAVQDYDYEGEQPYDEQAEADVPDEPDVLLDVPKLKLESLDLNVDKLNANVTLRANLANLVNLNVGADVELGKTELSIKGVDAQAFLKVYLDNVREILDRALHTLEQNPEILRNLAEGVGELGGGIGSAAENMTESGILSGAGHKLREGVDKVEDVAHGATERLRR